VSLVLDASITIASLFDDERTEAVDRIMERVSQSGGLTPSLWRLEVANVLNVAMRRGRCTQTFVDLSLGSLARLPIGIDTQTDLHAWGATLQLARECTLTPYDAAYLELALRARKPLASCDDELIAAATRKGVEVLSG